MFVYRGFKLVVANRLLSIRPIRSLFVRINFTSGVFNLNRFLICLLGEF